jgi:hypothetical protein
VLEDRDVVRRLVFLLLDAHALEDGAVAEG